MTTLASNHQMMLSTWQQHTQAEFALKDADAALATMTANPYVLFVPTGTGGTGREAVRDFYANRFLPTIPPDFGLASVSQIFAQDHIVEEFVVSFTHTLKMDWLLPGVPATRRKTEFPLVGVIRFENGKKPCADGRSRGRGEPIQTLDSTRMSEQANGARISAY